MNTARTLLSLGLMTLLTGCLGSAPKSDSGPGNMTGNMTGNGNMSGGNGNMGGSNGGTPAPVGNLICQATLSISGTYTQGNAPPADYEPGTCWPDGMWTFTATVTDSDCQNTPSLEPQYQFQVVEDADFNDTITYVTDPNNMNITTKISGGDGAICVGAFLIFSADGKTIYNLRPALQADNSLNGQGDIQVYDADQRNNGE